VAELDSAGMHLRVGRADDRGEEAALLRLDFPVRDEEDVERLLEFARTLLERNQQLETALRSRVMIEQAKGVLAERFGTDPEAAFQLLRRAARSNRLRIHELAARVVAEPSTPSEIAEVRER
jgi:hypothetical protein